MLVLLAEVVFRRQNPTNLSIAREAEKSLLSIYFLRCQDNDSSLLFPTSVCFTASELSTNGNRWSFIAALPRKESDRFVTQQKTQQSLPQN